MTNGKLLHPGLTPSWLTKTALDALAMSPMHHQKGIFSTPRRMFRKTNRELGGQPKVIATGKVKRVELGCLMPKGAREASNRRHGVEYRQKCVLYMT